MVYLSEGGRGWAGGEVVLPSPGSEPPPPYSPPRVPPHQHFFPPAFPALHPHHHYFQPFADYYDLTPAPSQPSSLSSHDTAPSIKDPPPPYPPMPTLKAAHAALNHGPSSAFSPPTKTIKYTYPPPYTPTDTAAAHGKVGVPVQQGGRREGQRDAGGGRATEPRHRERRSRPHTHDKARSLDHRDPRNRAPAHGQSRAASGSRRDETSSRVPGDAAREGHGRVPPLMAPGGGSGHPRGPLLRTGKSLELPHERTSHPPPATAHTHPAHAAHPRLPLLTKDGAQGAPPRTKEPTGAPRPAGAIATSKSTRSAHTGVVPAKPARSRHLAHVSPPAQARARPASRSEERWAARTSRLEAAAAEAMQAARAVPVNFVSSQPNALGPAPALSQGAEPEGHMSRGRLRSCRSLDELSDLLDEEAPRPPVATRSLDDLTEPLYENVDIIHAHARAHHHRSAHNTSVPDLLEAPPRPPRQRNNSLSSLLDDLGSCGSATLARRALNTSVPDVLEAGFSWGSPTSTLRSAASVASAPRRAHDATSDISVQLQKIREVARVLDVKYRRGELSSSSASSSGPPSAHTSPRMPSSAHTPPHHHAPGVPARAPVIHDVLRDSQKLQQQQQQQQQPPCAAGTPLPSLEADATSQESGYSSVDSRTYRQHQRSPPDTATSPPQHLSQQQQKQQQQQQQSQLRPQQQLSSGAQQPTRAHQQDSRVYPQHVNGSHRGQSNQSNYHDINEFSRKQQIQQQQRIENVTYRQQEQQHHHKLSPRQQQHYQHQTQPSQQQQPSKLQQQKMQQLRPQQQSSQQHKHQKTFLHRQQQQQQQEEESHSLPYQHQPVQQLHIQQVRIASCGDGACADFGRNESFKKEMPAPPKPKETFCCDLFRVAGTQDGGGG